MTIPGSPLCLCMCLAHFLSVLNDFSQGAHRNRSDLESLSLLIESCSPSWASRLAL